MKILGIIKAIAVGDAQASVGLLIRFMFYLESRGLRRAARLVSHRLQRRCGVFISPSTSVGSDLKLPHPVGIVVGAGVEIGQRVTIYQNVTLGGARTGDAAGGGYPRIGDDTVIFAGAVIAGPVQVGRNCTIGANPVVIQNVPDGTTAVGVPARTIS